MPWKVYLETLKHGMCLVFNYSLEMIDATIQILHKLCVRLYCMKCAERCIRHTPFS